MASPKTTTTTTQKRLHISFQPSLPSTADLQKSLRAHFGKFGNTVTAVKWRSTGWGGEAGIAKCVSSLSGSTWKGVKVRVGDAKQDYAQRIAAENAAPAPTRKRKRTAAGVHAPDMSLVTPENAATRAGWTEWGGCQSVGSDVDEEELLRVGGSKRDGDDENADEDGIEFVPMWMWMGTIRIKDLLIPHAEDTAGASFSLLGHLDLELDDDTGFAHLSAVAEPAHTTTQAPQVLSPQARRLRELLYRSRSRPETTTLLPPRIRDILDVAKDAGYPAYFCRTETEMRAKWEADKVELTRDWTRQWKEAVKDAAEKGRWARGARRWG
ncbi:hypothetical protein HMN09_00663800 [Mycena chlorophos]|uniref:Uncharacterized protein n=1 Tax=Mycena chlorophos TaxID=658473 RepID=A0A8H6SZQ7_MYCCL|nr:hypothetical protein HMN09_00663800 [Mycena chlorophos]